MADQSPHADDPVSIHNATIRDIIISICRPTLVAGGSPADVMIIVESVIVGVLWTVTLPGNEEAVLDVLVAGVKARLAEDRRPRPDMPLNKETPQ